MRKTNRRRAPIRLSESKLKKIIAESVSRVLKEESGSMTPESFRDELEKEFYDVLKDTYCSRIAQWGYYPPKHMDYVTEYAEDIADELTEEAIKLLQHGDWFYPPHSSRSLGTVMKERGINNFQELLENDNAVEIFTDWYWNYYGTHFEGDCFMSDFLKYVDD